MLARVLRRAQHHAFGGEALHDGRLVGPNRLGSRRLGQSKIQHLHAIPRQHDIGELHIAMRHASAMRSIQRIGYLSGVDSACSNGIGPFSMRAASVSPSISSITM